MLAFSEAVGHFSSRLNTVAQGWLQTFLGSNKQSPRDIGLLPRLHGTATLSMGCACSDTITILGPELVWETAPELVQKAPPGFGGPQGRSQGRDGKKPPGSGFVLYDATLIRASVGGPQQGAMHDALCRSAWQLSSPQLRI